MKLSRQIVQWVEKKRPGWLSYAILDFALEIDTPSKKTLRRVVMHNLCKRGVLSKHPTQPGIFLKQPEKVKWENY